MPPEREDGIDYRAAAIPIVYAMELQLAALRALLGSRRYEESTGDDGDSDGGVDGGHRDGVTDLDELTPRELQVLELLAQGSPNSAIAQSLGISVRTVKAHLGSIFSKLDVVGRTEAILRVLSDLANDDGPGEGAEGHRSAEDGG